MSRKNEIIKRVFDLTLSIIGLILVGWFIILVIIIATFDTKQSGIFQQKRIGQKGRSFKILKIRSMRKVKGISPTVSTSNDPRITKIGGFLRKTKIDELPQLINVLLGEMSFVGPRPDLHGYSDNLKGEDRIILTVKPGITGPASIYFKDEERLLASQTNPEEFNRNMIWPKKIEMNKAYVNNYSLVKDFRYILQTLF